MSVSIQKLEGVRAVKVSLNEGRAVVDLDPGNAITLTEIREQVRRNGFTPQGATATVRARVAAAGDALRLEVPETKEIFDVAATPHADNVAQLREHIGQVVTVEGLIAAPKGKTVAVIQIAKIQAAGAKREGR